MLKSIPESNLANSTSPNYLGLVEFLVGPLLESPDSLSIDCEKANNNQRVWIRLAFEGTDKGRVFGRGGRNLQAIRTLLSTAAKAVGQSLYLDVYEVADDNVPSENYRSYGSERKFAGSKPRSNRPPTPKPSVKSRWQQQ